MGRVETGPEHELKAVCPACDLASWAGGGLGKEMEGMTPSLQVSAKQWEFLDRASCNRDTRHLPKVHFRRLWCQDGNLEG